VVALLEVLAGSGAQAHWGVRPSVRSEPGFWEADVSKARDVLGWTPRTSLQEGLAATLAWMSGNLNYYRGGS
jgi:nucleoside-diphosphate-sugar epimerase